MSAKIRFVQIVESAHAIQMEKKPFKIFVII